MRDTRGPMDTLGRGKLIQLPLGGGKLTPGRRKVKRKWEKPELAVAMRRAKGQGDKGLRIPGKRPALSGGYDGSRARDGVSQ